MDSIVVNKVEVLKRKKNKITLMVVDTTTQVISSLQKLNLKYKVKKNAEYLDGSWSSQNYEWSVKKIYKPVRRFIKYISQKNKLNQFHLAI